MKMVENQIRRRGVTDRQVLEAMERVPRHEFVPDRLKDQAYGDFPLSIGYGQTISQPYIVALMSECLALEPSDKVLEIGTGSGYQAAVLAEIVSQVCSVGITQAVGRRSRRPPQAPGLHQRPRPPRRWLLRLAGSCPVRRHHRHLRGRSHPSRPGGAAGRWGPARVTGRPTGRPADALGSDQAGRGNRPEGHHRGALCPADRRARGI